MRHSGWLAAVKAAAGFAAGLALWAALTPLYDRVIAAGAEAAIRTFENPKVTRLRQAEDGYIAVHRTDFDPRSPRPAIGVYDLTFNFILLTTLFAAVPRPFSDRNIGGFLAASAVLALTHVFGTVAEVMSIYVAKLGMWSRVHYSDFERHFWGVASHAYKVVLMFAFAFGLWWTLRDAGAAPGRRRKRA